jgi:hypothetical protein
MQPSIPVSAIYPDAFIVRTLLIKPGYISHMIIYGFFSHIQAHCGPGSEMVAQKIKTGGRK